MRKVVMKFCNRQLELKELNTLYRQAGSGGRMTVLTGRRRVGKTLLSLEFAKKHRHVYLFVSRKNEPLLCEEFLVEIRRVFEIPVVGELKNFKDIFTLLLEISQKQHFTLIIDEFQEFFSVNPAVFADIQRLWDINKQRSKMNLILVGSTFSLMTRIFQDAKEPLFNRADRQMVLRPFSIRETAKILEDYHCLSMRFLFDIYVVTGGMPVYIDLLLTNKAKTFTKMCNFIFRPNSPFLNEGRNVLIGELGKDYTTYFSILELISVGKTSRSEIESILERNIGGFLDRLENTFSIVSKRRPINAKPGTRTQKYKIRDNFLHFWFRFLYRNRSALEMGNFEYLQDIVKRDYPTYCGPMLEQFFQELLSASGKYNHIGSYWTTGNKDEIDIVALDDKHKRILLAEVKLNKSKINMETLKRRAHRLLPSYPGYASELLGLSFQDIKTYL